MTANTNNHTIASEPRDPLRAAMLSVVPGIGQLYNGQSKKGFLYLGVAIINCIILSIMLRGEFLIRMMIQNGSIFFHRRLFNAISGMDIGSPVSLVLMGLIFAFTAHAVRDAYTHALPKRFSKHNANAILSLSEITSSIYIIQASFLILLTVLAFSFFVPKPAKRTLLVIEFDLVSLHKFDCHLPRKKYLGKEETKKTPCNQNPPTSKVEQDYFSGYENEFQSRIKRAWFPPNLTETKQLKVMFKIHRNGETSDLRISSSSGNQAADEAALEAVRNASPFKRLQDNAPEILDVEFIFDDNVSTLVFNENVDDFHFYRASPSTAYGR